MSYDLTIHFDGPGGDAARIRAMLDNEPGMRRVDGNRWVLTPVEPFEVAFDIEPRTEDESTIGVVRVHIPACLVEPVWESTFLLIFDIAERFYLQKFLRPISTQSGKPPVDMRDMNA